MMSVAEIQGWLATLPPDAHVGVDDGGLCLRVFGDEIYCEVGGLPEDVEMEPRPVSTTLGITTMRPIKDQLTARQFFAGYEGWTPASVGCHWTRGEYSISTWQCGSESGYALYRHGAGEVGRYDSFEEAARAAK